MSGNYNLHNKRTDSGYGSTHTPPAPSFPPSTYPPPQVTLRPRYPHEPRRPGEPLMVHQTTSPNHHGGLLPGFSKRAKSKIQKITNLTKAKPKTKAKSPTRGKTSVTKKAKPKSPPLPPMAPFCRLVYDPVTIDLSYTTNIGYLRSDSNFTRAIQSLQQTIAVFQERDIYTWIPHNRQQAWVDNTMEIFTESIQRANASLQGIVQRQRGMGPPGYAERCFSKGRWELVCERLQFLDTLMKGFDDSFHQ